MRPTPAAAAMSAMLISGSRARQSVAASRIAAMLRRASARCTLGAEPRASLEGILEIPFPEHLCMSYSQINNSYMLVHISSEQARKEEIDMLERWGRTVVSRRRLIAA